MTDSIAPSVVPEDDRVGQMRLTLSQASSEAELPEKTQSGLRPQVHACTGRSAKPRAGCRPVSRSRADLLPGGQACWRGRDFADESASC